jgi:hypothetical protein
MFQGATPAHFGKVWTASHRVAAQTEHDDGLGADNSALRRRLNGLQLAYDGSQKVGVWSEMWQ